jgi:uncharacterized protein with NAD-binding domain and iron-sulfur cluster
LGWRLGGKATSGRQRDCFDRSLEHGYHVLLGFYDNVFVTMMDCYQELGRDKDAPLAEFAALTADDEQFYPGRYAALRHNDLQVAQRFQGKTYFVPFNLPPNGLIPGDGTVVDVWSVLDLAINTLVRIADGSFFEVGDESNPPAEKPHISFLERIQEDIEHVVEMAETEVDRLLSLPFPLHVAQALWAMLKPKHALGESVRKAERAVVELIKSHIRRTWQKSKPTIETEWTTYRDWVLQDLIAANLCGILSEDLLLRGFDVANNVN